MSSDGMSTEELWRRIRSQDPADVAMSVVYQELIRLRYREEARVAAGGNFASPVSGGGSAGGGGAGAGTSGAGDNGGTPGSNRGANQGEHKMRVNTNVTAAITLDGLEVVVGERTGLQAKVDLRLYLFRLMGLEKARDLVGYELNGSTGDIRRELLEFRKQAVGGQALPRKWASVARLGTLLELTFWKDEATCGRFIEGRWDEDCPYLLSVADFVSKSDDFLPWSSTLDSQLWRNALGRGMDALSDAMVIIFDLPPMSRSGSYRMVRARLGTETCLGIDHSFIGWHIHCAYCKIFNLFRKGRPEGTTRECILYGSEAYIREVERRFDEAYRAIPGDQMPTFKVNQFIATIYHRIRWVPPGRAVTIEDRAGAAAKGKADKKRAATSAAAGGGAAAKVPRNNPPASGGQGRGVHPPGLPIAPAPPGRGVLRHCGFHLYTVLGIVDKKTGALFQCKAKADGTCFKGQEHVASLKALTRDQAMAAAEAMPTGLRPLGVAAITATQSSEFRP